MSTTPTPMEEAVKADIGRKQMTLGVPKVASDKDRRFPLTPEGAELLVMRGFDVIVESGAAEVIHFSDESYVAHGARIVNHAEAMRADVVLHMPAISESEARLLKPEAMLLTMFHLADQTKEAIAELLKRRIWSVAVDLYEDEQKQHLVADILSEIDGRAAMAIATALMADSVHGKGILLGGVAAVNPCEVVIMGSGIAACAAAKSAIGLGATVRMFDIDIHGMRQAQNIIGPSLIVSAWHPHTTLNAIRSADIVIATPSIQPYGMSADFISNMKRGVITFDISNHDDPVFPTLQQIDLANASACDCPREAQVRTCFVNAGSAVPRTAAQALSTTLIKMMEEILSIGISKTAIKQGFAASIYTFMGKVVNSALGQKTGIRPLDINLFFQMS